MQIITVEARMDANFPDAETFRRFGGLAVLQGECLRRLKEQGCAGEPEYAEPVRESERVWTLRATGEKP